MKDVGLAIAAIVIIAMVAFEWLLGRVSHV